MRWGDGTGGGGAGGGPDPFDDWVRQSAPRVEVSERRVDCLVAGVLAKTSASVPVPAWRQVLLRVAMPLAAGIVLGLLASRQLDHLLPVVQFSDMLLSGTFFPLDS